MNREKIKQIVSEAFDLESSQRVAFVRKACGDDIPLLNEVLSLLDAASSAQQAGFLPSNRVAGPPVSTMVDDRNRSDSDLPQRIGRYRILERLGGGGMGEVYVAEQTEPIKRRVAVKVIKAGMDTKQVVARFEAERQALAMMDHPNIAKVFDAGSTETGQPYFVMELVRGIPITKFCDDNKITTRQRVELLVPICQAVQHAHQKGIIHRDIKPHNVLVTLHDGKPVPKVIDFGIAKATSQPLTDKTIYTEFRAMIGTPAYMSPEQAEMSGLDIDTRSDIYSLGVLAYELLTGSPPFENERLAKAGLAEIQRIIKEEDPPRPSIRLSTIGDRLTTVAKSRDVEPSKLSKLLAGELDWIVMRAMEKDRKRRYDTATDLAADFNRHLSGEPVVAAPPTWTYRVHKFARKHRTPVAAGVALATLLSVGIVGTTTQMLRATKAELEAQAQRAEMAHDMERVHKSLEDLLVGTWGPEGTISEGAPQVMGSEIVGTGFFMEDQYDGRSHQVRIFPYNRGPKFGDLSESAAKAFSQPQQPVPAGILLQGLSQAVKESVEWLKDEENKSELEAYTADLALAQSAMASGNWPEARARLDACPQSKRGWEWTFLRKQAGETKYSLYNTTAYGFSRDGARMLAGVAGKSIRLLDTANGRPCAPPLQGVSPDAFKIGSCGLSSDGAMAVTIDSTAHAESANSPDGIKPGAGSVQIWDTATGKPVGTIWIPEGVGSITMGTAGTFATNSDSAIRDESPSQKTPVGQHVVRIWALANGRQVGKSLQHPNYVKSVCFSPDGKSVVTECEDGNARLWGLPNGDLITVIKQNCLDSCACAFNDDGSKFITTTDDSVEIHETSSGRLCQPPIKVKGRGKILCSDYSADGRHILTRTGGGFAISLWDAESATCIDPARFPGDWASFNPEGVLVGDPEGAMTFLYSLDGALLAQIDGGVIGKYGNLYAIDIDGSVNPVGPSYITIAPALEIGTVIENTLTDSAETNELAVASAISGSAELPPPSRSVKATMVGESFIDVVDASSGKSLARVGAPDAPIRSFVLSPDGMRLVVGDDTSIHFFGSEDWRQLAEFRYKFAVRKLQFTPDGTRLIVQFADGSAQIWDPRPLAERRKMWARRAAERTPAREYVDRLLGTAATTQPADLKKLIRDDASITPLRKLVALEQLDIELRKRQREAERKAASTQRLTKPVPVVPSSIKQTSDQ